MDVRNTGGNKYETTAREIQNYQFSTFFDRSKMTSRKVTATALKVNVKKFQPTSTSSLACVLTNLDAFCPMGVHLPGEKSILPYFSSPRGVAILDCDSHSQAGSTRSVCICFGHLCIFLLSRDGLDAARWRCTKK